MNVLNILSNGDSQLVTLSGDKSQASPAHPVKSKDEFKTVMKQLVEIGFPSVAKECCQRSVHIAIDDYDSCVINLTHDVSHIAILVPSSPDTSIDVSLADINQHGDTYAGYQASFYADQTPQQPTALTISLGNKVAIDEVVLKTVATIRPAPPAPPAPSAPPAPPAPPAPLKPFTTPATLITPKPQ